MAIDKKSGNGNGNGADSKGKIDSVTGVDMTGLSESAPVQGIRLGESCLYRPGPPGETSPGKRSDGKLHCGTQPIWGYVIECVTRDSEEFDEYEQFVILLTKPCLGIDGDKFKRAEAGQMIVVSAGGNLNELKRHAANPTHCAHAYIRPTGEFRKVKRGTMRVWEQVVTEMKERGLIAVPRLPALPAADSFDAKQLSAQAS